MGLDGVRLDCAGLAGVGCDLVRLNRSGLDWIERWLEKVGIRLGFGLENMRKMRPMDTWTMDLCVMPYVWSMAYEPMGYVKWTSTTGSVRVRQVAQTLLK